MSAESLSSAPLSDSRQDLPDNNVRSRAISDYIQWQRRRQNLKQLVTVVESCHDKKRPRRRFSRAHAIRKSPPLLKSLFKAPRSRAALRILMSGPPSRPPSRSSTPFRRPSTSQSSTRPRSSSTAGLVSEDAPPPGGRERLAIRFLAGQQPPPRPSSAAGGGPSGASYVRQRAISTVGSSPRRPFVPENSRLGPGTPAMPRTMFPPSPLNTSGRTYQLQVVQHPERSAEFASSSLSRLPLAPPPIVKLIIRNSLGSPINPDAELPFLVAHVSLCAEDGTSLDAQSREGSHRPIYGSLISSAQTLRDLGGSTGAYFVFPDISVRRRGRYKLCISLMRLQSGSSGRAEPVATLTYVYTHVFEIVSQSHYVAPELTPLTQYFIRQGARMYAFEIFASNRPNLD